MRHAHTHTHAHTLLFKLKHLMKPKHCALILAIVGLAFKMLLINSTLLQRIGFGQGGHRLIKAMPKQTTRHTCRTSIDGIELSK